MWERIGCDLTIKLKLKRRGRVSHLKRAMWWSELAGVWLKSHEARQGSLLGFLGFTETEGEILNVVDVVVSSSPSFSRSWVCGFGERERVCERKRVSELRESTPGREERKKEGKEMGVGKLQRGSQREKENLEKI